MVPLLLLPWQPAHAPLALLLPPQLFINNQFVDSVTGKTFTSWDPSTGEALVEVAEAQAEDVDRAVQAAKKVGGVAGWWCWWGRGVGVGTPPRGGGGYRG